MLGLVKSSLYLPYSTNPTPIMNNGEGEEGKGFFSPGEEGLRTQCVLRVEVSGYIR